MIQIRLMLKPPMGKGNSRKMCIRDRMEAVEAAAREIAKTDADLVLLDCIGYTAEMKRMVAKITGKNVILSRTILARAVMELLDY